MDIVALAFILLGLALLVAGAEVLVRGAVGLAGAAGISPLVTGLTIVALATSAPELAVGVQSALARQADLALGNVVGSNLFNLLAVLGVAALVRPLVVARQMLRFDLPVMLAATLALLALALDGAFGRWDGLALLAGFVLYTGWAVRVGLHDGPRLEAEFGHEYAVPRATPARLARYVALLVAGVVLLVAGADRLVDSAGTLARGMGVSDLLIGLTVVAVGTSLPELVTSVVAAVHGEGDIALGNCVGSSTLNILLVLGLTAVVSPDGVPVAPAALEFDLPVCLGVAALCLPIFFRGFEINRWEGALLLLYYAAYLAYRVLVAVEFDALPTFANVMLYFALPVSVLTVLALAARHAWGLRRGQPAG